MTNSSYQTNTSTTLLAWLFGIGVFILIAVDVLLIFLNMDTIPVDSEWGFRGFQAAIAIPFTIIGVLIAVRQPRNPIGWLMLLSSALGVLSELAGEYAYYAIFTAPGSLPGADFASWLTAWTWAPGTAAFIIFSFLYFPNGKLLSPRWRWVVWLSIASVTLVCLLFAFLPGSAQLTGIENPYAFDFLSTDQAFFNFVPQMFLLVPALVAVASLVIRFRRARGIERQQMKWFVLAAIFAPFAILLGSFDGLLANILLVAIVYSVPITMALAILRYRLWDIDVIIRRTLVYGILTGLLIAIYFISVLLLQNLLTSLTGQQTTIAIVISTLAIAALFNPLRRRIQNFIDRRFYRQKYDAEKALADFGLTVREEVDLESLSHELLTVVQETMQPESVSVWLKEGAENQ